MTIKKENSKNVAQIEFLLTQPKNKSRAHKISGKQWEPIDAKIFMLNKKKYLCIVDYHNTDGLSADHLMNAAKLYLKSLDFQRK